ncbi:hypothetical protein M422DRAFT_38832 [Sphaerobolus stellatus SS14]|uniref:Unplaced genomic scaffold SPHSTscaffold_346, whole genome shotgun sequence n=1 Tax=Sphaerobolus stellatus (strain SS14) TaxID=990650 RepID=A0A0C9T8H1_SPHS4|nr:hypothetical protein M422DRAFT_38832 [Sphaerobolus stellatus SS14]
MWRFKPILISLAGYPLPRDARFIIVMRRPIQVDYSKLSTMTTVLRKMTPSHGIALCVLF